MQETGEKLPTSVDSFYGNTFANGCVEFFEEAVEVFGLPPSVGQIYGLLYGSPRPLSFTDIVERLGISKGSVSGGLQFLHSIGAVRIAGNEGGRREYFEPELSLRRLIKGILRNRVGPLAASGDERIEHLRILAARDAATEEFSLGRVAQLETWRRRLRAVTPVLTALLGPAKNKK